MQMGEVLSAIDTFDHRLGKVLSFLIVGKMVVVFIEVIMRYIFNSPTIWSNEAVQFLYAGYIALGGAYALLHNAHVNIDIVYGRFSLKTRAVVDLVTSLFFFAYFGVMLWQGSIMAAKSVKIMEATASNWGPALWPIKVIVPIAALLFLLQGIVKYIRNVRFLTHRESQIDRVGPKEML